MEGDLTPGTSRKKSYKRCKATVLIASADAGLRRQWVKDLLDACAIHEVSERAALEHTVTHSKPAVLLLDIDLPQLGDIQGVSAIQRLSPSTKIILLTSAHDEKKAIGALKARAKGYCAKQIEPALLRKAINLVQKGEIWVGRKAISRLLAELTSLAERSQKDSPTPSKVLLSYLTSRQQQIALLIGSGGNNKDIARQLNISEKTVKSHLTAIFHKLQIPDRLRLGLFVTGRSP